MEGIGVGNGNIKIINRVQWWQWAMNWEEYPLYLATPNSIYKGKDKIDGECQVLNSL